MAEKKKRSQAEKAVSASRKFKKANNKPADKEKGKAADKKQLKIKEVEIPVRLVTSCVFLISFVVLLVARMIPDGVVIRWLSMLVQGLVGNLAFLLLIPAMLYLFGIHAFSGDKPVTMRTVCVFVFVLSCGCLSHLVLNSQPPADGKPFLVFLYEGGIAGWTGGIICGAITSALAYLMSHVLTFVILLVTALLTLLGAMQITVFGIIRAIQERPRVEEEDAPPKPDPATVVVNHLAERRIARKEEKRRMAAAMEETPDLPEQKASDSQNALDIMRQIDADVHAPVAAAAVPVTATNEDEILTAAASDSKAAPKIEDAFPENMPDLDVDDAPVVKKPAKQPEKVTAKDAEASALQVAQEIEENQKQEKPVYYFPPIDLLKRPAVGGVDGTAEMRENSRRLNETLESFKIEAHIINVTRGPSVTRYEVELEKGVRLSKLTTAADDIALSLGASGVRIAAVPGKISVVGIEVPNRAVTSVSLREVIDSQEFHKAKSMSSFAVGKDIGGNCIIGNIARLPHMLIAGTTGSGKSVCMNSIIISLLYKASPDDVKLIMVDPKMVELVNYNNIPHLLIPVVTDPKKAAGSLQWAVTEMMRRYKTMSDAGVRDLESYNSLIESQQAEGTKLPQVVVIIDELADLMLVAAKEVEESICRIAQMGRAAGIHLIIATQRPSADVITGLMKANIPSRIAFAVASAMESRIILDTQGAEKLVGRGDMLYAPIGNGKPLRVQGCFVSEQEIEAVTNHVKSAYSSNYDQQIMEDIERKAAQSGTKTPTASDPEPNADELDGDEMLPAAVDVILETGQASVSMLQRRLKLGYARAARIVDEMEEKGIVGPFQGSKPRDILVTKEQWEAMRSGSSAQMEFDDLEEDEDF